MTDSLSMNSLGDGYRALVIGASGALGTAFCDWLKQDPRCAAVRELGRKTIPALDLEHPETIASAAAELATEAPYQLIVHAAGLLHRDAIKPEKSYSALEDAALQAVFQVNTLGPAMVLRHFLPLLDPQGAMAMLSAKVGSIGDNLGRLVHLSRLQGCAEHADQNRGHRTGPHSPAQPLAEPASWHGRFGAVATFSRCIGGPPRQRCQP